MEKYSLKFILSGWFIMVTTKIRRHSEFNPQDYEMEWMRIMINEAFEKRQTQIG